MNKEKKLKELSKYYFSHNLSPYLEKEIKETLGINLKAQYGNFPLKNPIIVAPGQLSVHPFQIEKIYQAGYAACVLKSVVGEDKNGNCSMFSQRKRATKIETFYEKNDKDGRFPIIHWDGRCDHRTLKEYLLFVRTIKKKKFNNFLLIGSFLCHLPTKEKSFKAKEWVYTCSQLYQTDYRIAEIDFCPYLKKDNFYQGKKEILRWYKNVPRIIKSHRPEMKIFPKLLNPQWGLKFQVKMAEAALEGGADGLVVANRIYKEEYNSGHGGEELRLLNLKQIKAIKKSFPEVPISATGGVYSGRHILEYLKAGAQNIQILSYIMGRVKEGLKRNGTKLEKVFYNLLFDENDGLIASIIREGY